MATLQTACCQEMSAYDEKRAAGYGRIARVGIGSVQGEGVRTVPDERTRSTDKRTDRRIGTLVEGEGTVIGHGRTGKDSRTVNACLSGQGTARHIQRTAIDRRTVGNAACIQGHQTVLVDRGAVWIPRPLIVLLMATPP